MTQPPPRSWLFVPADSEKKVAKALASDADAIIFDLEDSVVPGNKQAARNLLVFDAIDYGLEPGTLQVVKDGDIPSYLGIGKMSLHQSSFQEVLALASLSGHTPKRAVLVGVQPAVLMDFGGSLTEVVRAKIPQALRIGVETLAYWGVPGRPREGKPADALFDPSLAIERYESGRPDAAQACRIGDARVLAMRAANER